MAMRNDLSSGTVTFAFAGAIGIETAPPCHEPRVLETRTSETGECTGARRENYLQIGSFYPISKTADGASRPRVQIPPPPLNPCASPRLAVCRAGNERSR